MKPTQITRNAKIKRPAEGATRQGYKKAKMLKQSRGLLDNINEKNATAVLNTIFSVSPVVFDRPEIQKKIYELFPNTGEHSLDLSTLNMMRLYRKSRARKIAICCMPKSGSTFILTSLKRLEKFRFHYGYLHVPYANPSFVDAVPNENEIDELALLIHEMLDRPTLVHTHTKSSPHTDKLLFTHGYKPIVVQRNIFDCIVSMDDMALKEVNFPGFGMFHPPKGYNDMPREDRLAFLTQLVGPWYIDFIVSWSRTRLKPVFLNYDADILGFDEGTADKLRTGLKLDDITTAEMMEAFQLKTDHDKRKARLNKGESGRGADIPQEVRDAIRRLADVYASEVDFTGLV